ncbi:uncharacterized protein FYW49_003748 [Xenentodon cancila]
MPLPPVDGMPGRRRRPNWTDQECLLLAQLMQERKDIIRRKCSTAVSIQDKRHAWGEIAQTINDAFPQVRRTVSDCNKKWENLLAKARDEIRRQKKHAGKGEGLSIEQFSAVTQIVISVMNLSEVLQQDREDSSISVPPTEQKSTNLLNVGKSLTVHLNSPLAAVSRDSGDHYATSCSPSAPSAHCTRLPERMDLEMSVLRRQEAVLKLQQEYYTLKIRLMKKQMEELSQQD